MMKRRNLETLTLATLLAMLTPISLILAEDASPPPAAPPSTTPAGNAAAACRTILGNIGLAVQRFAGPRSSGSTMTIGREREVADLLDRVSASASGESPGIILVSGPSKAGKTRVIETAMAEYLRANPHADVHTLDAKVLTGSSSPAFGTSHQAGFQISDPLNTLRAELDQVAQSTPDTSAPLSPLVLYVTNADGMVTKDKEGKLSLSGRGPELLTLLEAHANNQSAARKVVVILEVRSENSRPIQDQFSTVDVLPLTELNSHIQLLALREYANALRRQHNSTTPDAVAEISDEALKSALYLAKTFLSDRPSEALHQAKQLIATAVRHVRNHRADLEPWQIVQKRKLIASYEIIIKEAMGIYPALVDEMLKRKKKEEAELREAEAYHKSEKALVEEWKKAHDAADSAAAQAALDKLHEARKAYVKKWGVFIPETVSNDLLMTLAAHAAPLKNISLNQEQDLRERLADLVNVMRDKFPTEGAIKYAQAIQTRFSGMLGGGRPKSKPNRPLVVLKVGTPSSGKTFSATIVTELLFPGSGNLHRIDGNTLKELHMTQSQIGSPSGYVGDNQGVLIKAILASQGKLVIQWDEADRSVQGTADVFMALMESGLVQDGLGQEYKLDLAVFELTSNAGSELMLEMRRQKEAEIAALEKSRGEKISREDRYSLLQYTESEERQIYEAVRAKFKWDPAQWNRIISNGGLIIMDAHPFPEEVAANLIKNDFMRRDAIEDIKRRGVEVTTSPAFGVQLSDWVNRADPRFIENLFTESMGFADLYGDTAFMQKIIAGKKYKMEFTIADGKIVRILSEVSEGATTEVDQTVVADVATIDREIRTRYEERVESRTEPAPTTDALKGVLVPQSPLDGLFPAEPVNPPSASGSEPGPSALGAP